MADITMNGNKKTLYINNEKVAVYKKNLKDDFAEIELAISNAKKCFDNIANDKGTSGQVKTTMQKASAALKTVGEKNSNWNKGIESKINKVVQAYAQSVLGSLLDDLAQSATDLSKLN
jgi:hypothetical protein